MAKMGQPPPYKFVIRESIMSALFTKTAELSYNEMVNLINKNCALMGYSHKSFAYNGKFYSVEFIEGPPVRQRLHHALLPEMRKYLDEFGYNFDMEKAKIAGYVNSVMAMSDLPGDYLLLFPSALHAVVQGAVMCDWSTSLSPEKIDAFKAKYQTGYDLVRNRMAINLVL